MAADSAIDVHALLHCLSSRFTNGIMQIDNAANMAKKKICAEHKLYGTISDLAF